MPDWIPSTYQQRSSNRRLALEPSFSSHACEYGAFCDPHPCDTQSRAGSASGAPVLAIIWCTLGGLATIAVRSPPHRLPFDSFRVSAGETWSKDSRCCLRIPHIPALFRFEEPIPPHRRACCPPGEIWNKDSTVVRVQWCVETTAKDPILQA